MFAAGQIPMLVDQLVNPLLGAGRVRDLTMTDASGCTSAGPGIRLQGEGLGCCGVRRAAFSIGKCTKKTQLERHS